LPNRSSTYRAKVLVESSLIVAEHKDEAKITQIELAEGARRL